jgi:CHASE3 domain sensor protein
LLIITLDHIRENPAAVDALTSAMYERRELVTDLITDNPKRLDSISATLMQTAAKKPNARAAIRGAMNDERAPVAHIIVEDPGTVGNLMKAMVDAGLAHSILQHTFAEATKK